MASTYPDSIQQPPSRDVGPHDSSSGFSSSVTRCIEDRPDEAVVLSLLSGLAVGVAIGIALGAPREKQSWYDRRTAEDLGNRLLSSLEQVLPESLSRTIGIK